MRPSNPLDNTGTHWTALAWAVHSCQHSLPRISCQTTADVHIRKDKHYNVNPGLINHGLLIRGGTPQIVIIWYLNGIPPIKQPRGLLIQGWHYKMFTSWKILYIYMYIYIYHVFTILSIYIMCIIYIYIPWYIYIYIILCIGRSLLAPSMILIYTFIIHYVNKFYEHIPV